MEMNERELTLIYGEEREREEGGRGYVIIITYRVSHPISVIFIEHFNKRRKE
jgi:hypothetical protein